MIFNDRVNVTLKEKVFVNGTAKFVEVFNGPVPGIVTFLDSKTVFDPAGNKTSSRLQIVLSPFAFEIPAVPAAGTLSLSYKNFSSLIVDGAVEPHYQNGRLHHYEIIAKAA